MRLLSLMWFGFVFVFCVCPHEQMDGEPNKENENVISSRLGCSSGILWRKTMTRRLIGLTERRGRGGGGGVCSELMESRVRN